MAAEADGFSSIPDPPPVLFRPSKKRKAVISRHRNVPEPTEDDDRPTATPASRTTLASDNDNDNDAGHANGYNSDEADTSDDGAAPVSMADLIRRRNARKARAQGIAFRSGGSSNPDHDTREGEASSAAVTSAELVLRDDAAAEQVAIPSRFTTATGLIGELNSKHMMEYIESRLSRNRGLNADAADTSAATASKSRQPHWKPLHEGIPAVEAQSAALRGKLLEVDLGEEVRSRNVALTQRARQQLAGDDEADPQSGGKDRARRGSDDIQRDRFIEEFLHENKLDVYDMEYPDSPDDDDDDEVDHRPVGPTDDRIADQFRREFMEALHQRQQLRRRRRRPAVGSSRPPAGSGSGNGGPVRPGKKDDGEILRGPKLGGSRNSRAQMRDLLLAQAKEKKTAQGRR